MYDLGVQAIAAARMLFGSEPAQVMAMSARTTRRYGGDVDEGTVALIRFPEDRLAHFHSSFGEEPVSTMSLLGEEGWLTLSPAYRHDVETTLIVSRLGRLEHTTFPPSDQYAAEINYFSDCILTDRQPESSGIEGLLDTRTIEAIYRSGRDGRPVTLPRLARVEATAAPEIDARKLDAMKRAAS